MLDLGLRGWDLGAKSMTPFTTFDLIGEGMTPNPEQNFPSLSSRTRNSETLGWRLGIGLGFGLDISVFRVSDSESESKFQGIADLKEENVIIYGFLKGNKQNQTRNSETLGSGLGIGLGIGIASSLCSVSDSESDSEFWPIKSQTRNRDSKIGTRETLVVTDLHQTGTKNIINENFFVGGKVIFALNSGINYLLHDEIICKNIYCWFRHV